MRVDVDLIRRAKDAIATMPSRRQAQAELLLDAYQTARKVSQGPDAERAKAWEVKAFDARHDLVKFLDEKTPPTLGDGI